MNLLAVQHAALKKSGLRPGFAHFMEQGLGKTLVTLVEFNHLKKQNKVDCLIIVCPNSLKSNWKNEIRDWKFDYNVGLWPNHDPRKEPFREVFVINYEATIAGGGFAVEEYLYNHRCMLVYDESSKIKSHAAKISKKAILFSKYAAYCRILSGTPMSQSVMDLWPQLRFIGELSGVNPYAFRNKYAVMGGYMGKQITGFKNEEELHKLLDSCSFRAKKHDWLDTLPDKLPPVTRDIVMTNEQKIVYKEMRDNFVAQINGIGISSPQVITQMERLSQICRGFIYDEEGKAVELVPPSKNPAIKVLDEVLEQTVGKVIVVTVHKYITETLITLYDDCAYIKGDMTIEEVDEQKRKFNNDPLCRKIICQTSAAAYGHTLLGGTGDDRCSTTVFFENQYSLEKRQQMEDRNHRIGQDKGVLCIDFISSETDRRAIRALQKKENVVKIIVDAVRSLNIKDDLF